VKKSCGQALREARQRIHLTQTQAAKKIGISFSLLAHIEADRRRPALGHLNRFADVLQLDQRRLLVLGYPEASSFFRKRHRSADWAWQAFIQDRAFLTQHHVRPRELKMLAQVKTLGRFHHPRDFFFVLNSIRQAEVGREI
jgi:transcriptional regulator with XRE-family HTH domain